MTIASPPLQTSSFPLRYRWSLEAYEKAVAQGVWDGLPALELITGELYEKMPINPPHATGVQLSQACLTLAFSGQDAHCRVQQPLRIPDDSEPEPDIVVVRHHPREYRERHPEPAEVLLLVEVSDSTLAFDRTTKRDLYARAGVAEYWIVNLGERQVEVFRRSGNESWEEFQVYGVGESIAPLLAPDSAISVVDLLP